MDWFAKMNAVLDEIERNLTGEIDLNVLCMKAGCSSYNFQRMFSFITDIPLAEYIRRRRLTAAAFELKNGGCRVVDIAVKYGYDSATSFARAFGALHGVAPSEARRDGAKLKAYPRISFQISIKGEKQMDYRIETKEAFEVFGIETIASLAGEDGHLSQRACGKNVRKTANMNACLKIPANCRRLFRRACAAFTRLKIMKKRRETLSRICFARLYPPAATQRDIKNTHPFSNVHGFSVRAI